MDSIRQKQTAEVIRRHFGTVLLHEGRNIFEEAFVTVTKVYVTPDISMAKIYLSVYNVEDKQKIVDKATDNIHHLKKNLARRIRKHVRRIPEIDFYLDDTLDEMYRVDSLFKELKADGKMGTEEE